MERERQQAMNFYFAPLEGITGYIYRNAFQDFFGEGIDRYFTPFIVAAREGTVKNRSLKDIYPENNKGISLVPQILGNNAENFISLSRKIRELGYGEVNLNLGCPYGTVVSKGKGAGFLAKKEELEAFLDRIFTANVTEISIKTRIGKDSPEEFKELLLLYNQFPVKELIIHPRIQLDLYKNRPNMAVFEQALLKSKNSVCYNGDIFTVSDYKSFCEKYPNAETIMIGRGLLANPSLVRKIRTGKALNKEELESFHDRLLSDYCEVMSGDKNTLFKMKDLWNYMQYLFPEADRQLKKIRKAQKIADYKAAVRELFANYEMKESAGFEGSKTGR